MHISHATTWISMQTESGSRVHPDLPTSALAALAGHPALLSGYLQGMGSQPTTMDECTTNLLRWLLSESHGSSTVTCSKSYQKRALQSVCQSYIDRYGAQGRSPAIARALCSNAPCAETYQTTACVFTQHSPGIFIAIHGGPLTLLGVCRAIEVLSATAAAAAAKRPLPHTAQAAAQACCMLADHIPLSALANMATGLLASSATPLAPDRTLVRQSESSSMVHQRTGKSATAWAVEAGLELAEAYLRHARSPHPCGTGAAGLEDCQMGREDLSLPSLGHSDSIDVKGRLVRAVAVMVGGEASGRAERCLCMALPNRKGGMITWYVCVHAPLSFCFPLSFSALSSFLPFLTARSPV
jgi:hypothetical protein